MPVDYVGFAYAATVAAGGVIGYIKAGTVLLTRSSLASRTSRHLFPVFIKPRIFLFFKRCTCRLFGTFGPRVSQRSRHDNAFRWRFLRVYRSLVHLLSIDEICRLYYLSTICITYSNNFPVAFYCNVLARFTCYAICLCVTVIDYPPNYNCNNNNRLCRLNGLLIIGTCSLL